MKDTIEKLTEVKSNLQRVHLPQYNTEFFHFVITIYTPLFFINSLRCGPQEQQQQQEQPTCFTSWEKSWSFCCRGVKKSAAAAAAADAAAAEAAGAAGAAAADAAVAEAAAAAGGAAHMLYIFRKKLKFLLQRG